MAFVFDFGGTSVKCGIARYESGELASLRVLESLPSPQRVGDRAPQTLAAIIGDTIRSQGLLSGGAVDIAVSIASYVRGNHLLAPPHASYVDIDGIENLGAWLGDQLGALLGLAARVRLVHDGTASALSVSPDGERGGDHDRGRFWVWVSCGRRAKGWCHFRPTSASKAGPSRPRGASGLAVSHRRGPRGWLAVSCPSRRACRSSGCSWRLPAP